MTADNSATNSHATEVTAAPAQPLGVHVRGDGVDVAVWAGHAEAVYLCVVNPDGTERQHLLPQHSFGVWHGHVPSVPVESRYGFRVHGPWNPDVGHRHNPAKLLLDPYARAIDYAGPTGRGARLQLTSDLFGHPVGPDFTGDTGVRDTRDSASSAPLGVVLNPLPTTLDDRPRHPWDRTVIYEAHVKGLTAQLADVPEPLRGTYAGLAHPATLAHLTRLGVTTVELLPIFAISDEPNLVVRGRHNYWGYSTLGFFAPHPGYAAATDSVGVLTEFRDMVTALHAANMEVVLDVVFNHTCEGGVAGPTLSWRGLDAATYYRLDGHGRDIDTTGCGNTLDFTQTPVIQLTLDSLRYWVQTFHVDGFRFDLAPTLARQNLDFDPHHPLLVALQTDPVLRGVKLIAEPWDVGPHGWLTGHFPAPITEWNDMFRDGARRFWLQGANPEHAPHVGVHELATRLAGSADRFSRHRGPLSTVNFVTAHDGFTLADACAYDQKHNEANGENNRDGSDHNLSWNHGSEGTQDLEKTASGSELTAARIRSVRNMWGTLAVARGVPMVLAGDEFGRTQGGNNNPYCLDDETTWFDWNFAPWQHDLMATARHLLQLRRDYAALRPASFATGLTTASGRKDLAWFAGDGNEMGEHWVDANQRIIQMYVRDDTPGGCQHRSERFPARPPAECGILVLLHGSHTDSLVRLPPLPWGKSYDLLWDSAYDTPPGTARGPKPHTETTGATLEVPALTMRLYHAICG